MGSDPETHKTEWFDPPVDEQTGLTWTTVIRLTEREEVVREVAEELRRLVGTFTRADIPAMAERLRSLADRLDPQE